MAEGDSDVLLSYDLRVMIQPLLHRRTPLTNFRSTTSLRHPPHPHEANIRSQGPYELEILAIGTMLTICRPGSSGRYQARRGSTASSIHSIGGTLDTASYGHGLNESGQNGNGS